MTELTCQRIRVCCDIFLMTLCVVVAMLPLWLLFTSLQSTQLTVASQSVQLNGLAQRVRDVEDNRTDITLEPFTAVETPIVIEQFGAAGPGGDAEPQRN